MMKNYRELEGNRVARKVNQKILARDTEKIECGILSKSNQESLKYKDC